MATPRLLSNEEVNSIAERVQEQFVQEYEDSDEIDPQDYKRVKTCLPYVCKFVRQKMGDQTNAYEMLAEAQKWRKSFGVQNLSLDKIDPSYFHTGVGFPRGEDRDGSTLLILNCHLHKKDAKKFPQLQKFFIFCMESLVRRFPDKKVTMLFNMSECGISNMDMEFVKFIINCFKFYFPDMLNYLLVFEMPWVLQAAWRIIKGWLGEAAIRKIKFVTKSDITEYVAPDQLLEKFGGTDKWTYKYDQEELKEVMGDIWVRDPLIMEDNEPQPPSDNESGIEDSVKQVRFAPGQPPTRQSRYGDPDDESDGSTNSWGGKRGDTSLRKGTASSPGFRKRQVGRLLTSAQKQPSTDDSQAMTTSLSGTEGQQDTQSASKSSIHSLKIRPSEELQFAGADGDELVCEVILENICDRIVAYKIKTTAPDRYKVRPNVNLIGKKNSAVVQVKLLSGSSESVAQDKFLVQAYRFSSDATPPPLAQLPNFWKTISKNKAIEEFRLKCRYSKQIQKSSSQLSTKSTKETASKSTDLVILEAKIDRGLAMMKNLEATMNKVFYVCIVLLVLLLINIAHQAIL